MPQTAAPRRRTQPAPAVVMHTSAPDVSYPALAAPDGTPLTRVLDYAEDRTRRLEVILDNLERQLLPLLSDELADQLDQPTPEPDPEPLPRAVSTRIGRHADHVDQLADRLARLRDHLEV